MDPIHVDARIIELLFKKIQQGFLEVEDELELTKWRNISSKNVALEKELTDPMKLMQLVGERSRIDTEAAWKNISRTSPVVKLLRWASVAAIFVAISIGAYLWTTSTQKKNAQEPVIAQNQEEILPGSDKAVLTLSNGQQVVLNNNTSEIINDGSLPITNKNGVLAYSAKSSAEQYNTMATPKGGQYKLVLSDGTKVWLNAASSITYPVVFKQGDRVVKISGEAYFEVAKNKDKKFVVQSDGISTEVLGTHFNINTYSDETSKSVTLLEGLVRVKKNGNQLLLNPGQQAIIENNSIIFNRYADTASVMGWKNGIFQFNRTPLKAAMRQLARWYDITVIYKSEPDVDLGGNMGRDLTLQQSLTLLSRMGVKYKLKGKVLEIQ